MKLLQIRLMHPYNASLLHVYTQLDLNGPRLSVQAPRSHHIVETEKLM